MKLSILKHFSDIWLVVRYGISGGLSIVVNIAGFYILNSLLNMWHVYAAVIAFVFAYAVAFLLQKYWTFRDFDRNTFRKQALWYLLFALLGLALNILLLLLLVDVLGVKEIVAQIIAQFSIAFLLFLFNKTVTFKGSDQTLDV